MNTRMIRCYSELIRIPEYVERFRYLKLDGCIGMETFGYDRYLNQILYRTGEWRRFRNEIIVRDRGCDLGHRDYEIVGQRILVHHINPITADDVINRNPKVFDPENVITTVLLTHNAIHYGDEDLLITEPIERKPNDTCPWRQMREV